ncbi:MAG: hypothetical protein WCH74_02860 [Chloroflexota bacterium]
MVTRRTSLLAGLLVAVLAVAACSGSSGGTIPDITGTWTGSARFADVDGSIKTSPEKLVVEKQDSELVWGTVEYPNADGTTAKATVTGTFIDGGKGIVLTEPTTLWQGTVNGNTMTVTISWNRDPSHGAFQVTLTRQ